MNKSKQTITLVLAGLLAAGNAGLFVYDNVYLKNKEGESKVTVYAAKQNIQSNTTITEDLFMVLELPANGALPTYITDISTVVGKKVSGGLLKNDVLTATRIATASYVPEGNLSVNIVPDVKVQLEENDAVVVYLREKKTGDMNRLFDSKTIIGSQSEGTVYNVLATENEVQLYYKSKLKGDIILVKRTEDFSPEETTTVIPKEQNIIEQTVNQDSNLDSDSYTTPNRKNDVDN